MARLPALVVLFCVLMAQCCANKTIPLGQESHTIVGGRPTSIVFYPYQLSLRKYSAHFCGAALIGKTWALTAAHCCVKITATSQLSVKAGSSSISVGGDVYGVKRIIRHGWYNSDTTDYDICLIETLTPVRTSYAVKPIQLGAVSPSLYGEEMVVTGWGTLWEDGDSPDTLQVVGLPLIANEGCKQRFRAGGQFKFAKHITERQLCAGAEAAGKDSCQGDSGGPLMYDNKLLGIVSWGIGCGRHSFPGLYTNVNYFRSWIERTTGKL